MTHIPDTERTPLMSWNIKSGGFSSYDPTLTVPERETLIQAFVHEMHVKRGVDSVCLPDAYRWDEIYGGNDGIAAHLGYVSARFVRLEDERLKRDNGAGIGIAFAADRHIEQSKALDLDTRQGLGVVLAVGRYGLQVASVYLDDMSEEVRTRQIRALHADLEPDVPTVLVGDFSALRRTMEGASLRDRTKDLAVRAAAHVLPRKSNLGVSVAGMNRREVVPLLNLLGYTDADDAKKRPTAPSMLPSFGIDYVFTDRRVESSQFDVIPTKSSDHSAIIADISTR